MIKYIIMISAVICVMQYGKFEHKNSHTYVPVPLVHTTYQKGWTSQLFPVIE